jgi:hypothetical protein
MRCQAGGTYGLCVTDAHGHERWHLLAGCTLVEAAYQAREERPEAEQVQANFARPYAVHRKWP